MLTPSERDAWLDCKRGFVGASEIGALFDVHPYHTVLSLWGRKTGRIPPDVENKYMRIGSAMEGVIASEYCLATGRAVYADMLEPDHATVHRFGPMAMYSCPVSPISCTPDRIINPIDWDGREEMGACQLKWRAVPYGDAWKVEEGVVQFPMATQMQVQMEIGILGLAWGSAAALVGGDLRYRDFPRNDKFFATAMEKANQFMWFVKNDQQPPDVTAEDRETLCQLYPKQIPGKVIALPEEAAAITEKYEQAKEAVARYESIVEQAKAQIQAMLGDAEKGIVPGDGGAWTWKHKPAYPVKAHECKASRPLWRTKI